MMCTLELMQNEMKGATANLFGNHRATGNGQQATGNRVTGNRLTAVHGRK